MGCGSNIDIKPLDTCGNVLNYKNTTFRIEGNNVFKDGLFFGFLVCMTDKEITIRHRDKRITKLILS